MAKKTQIKEIKILAIILSVVSLLAGGWLYLLFRSKTLLMFKWMEELRLLDLINNMRAEVSSDEIPQFVIYALPDGLWVFSYILIVSAVWDFHFKASVCYVLIIPTIALLSEFGQIFDIVPGTFDIADIASYFIATFLGILLTKQINNYLYEKESY